MRKVAYRNLGHASQRDCDRLVALMRRAEPVAFKYEGEAIHLLRSLRCLAGWRYAAADTAARDIVRCGLSLAGAVRPSMEDAQGIPHPNAAETCLTCGNTLYGAEVAFCSRRCNIQHQTFRHSVIAADARADLKCLICKKPLNARTAQRRFCSNRCIAISQHRGTPIRTCIQCGIEYQRYHAPKRDEPAFCSHRCASNWQWRQRGVGPRKLHAGSAETTTGGHWDEAAEAAYQAKRAERYRTYQRNYKSKLRAAAKAAAAAAATSPVFPVDPQS